MLQERSYRMTTAGATGCSTLFAVRMVMTEKPRTGFFWKQLAIKDVLLERHLRRGNSKDL